MSTRRSAQHHRHRSRSRAMPVTAATAAPPSAEFPPWWIAASLSWIRSGRCHLATRDVGVVVDILFLDVVARVGVTTDSVGVAAASAVGSTARRLGVATEGLTIAITVAPSTNTLPLSIWRLPVKASPPSPPPRRPWRRCCPGSARRRRPGSGRCRRRAHPWRPRSRHRRRHRTPGRCPHHQPPRQRSRCFPARCPWRWVSSALSRALPSPSASRAALPSPSWTLPVEASPPAPPVAVASPPVLPPLPPPASFPSCRPAIVLPCAAGSASCALATAAGANAAAQRTALKRRLGNAPEHDRETQCGARTLRAVVGAGRRTKSAENRRDPAAWLGHGRHRTHRGGRAVRVPRGCQP